MTSSPVASRPIEVGAPRPDGSLSSLRQVYLVRGLIALVWAGVFASASGSLDAGAIALLVIYPLVDAAASLVDARTHRGTDAQRSQVVNGGLSMIAAIAVATASTDDIAAVLHAFGAWAIVSGVIQLVLAVRRRPQFGRQWGMLISGGLSAVVGLRLNLRAASDDPELGAIAAYAAFGGLFFIVSAISLTRRARRTTRTGAVAA